MHGSSKICARWPLAFNAPVVGVGAGGGASMARQQSHAAQPGSTFHDCGKQ